MKGTETRVQKRLRAAGVTRPGPESVTWKVNREILVVAEGERGHGAHRGP